VLASPLACCCSSAGCSRLCASSCTSSGVAGRSGVPVLSSRRTSMYRRRLAAGRQSSALPSFQSCSSSFSPEEADRSSAMPGGCGRPPLGLEARGGGVTGLEGRWAVLPTSGVGEAMPLPSDWSWTACVGAGATDPTCGSMAVDVGKAQQRPGMAKERMGV